MATIVSTGLGMHDNTNKVYKISIKLLLILFLLLTIVISDHSIEYIIAQIKFLK